MRKLNDETKEHLEVVLKDLDHTLLSRRPWSTTRLDALEQLKINGIMGLGEMNLPEANFLAVVCLLSKCATSLRTLCLQHCDLGTFFTADGALTRQLASTTALETLDLNNNGAFTSVNVIEETISRNNSLQYLNLALNDLGFLDPDCVSLGRAMLRTTTIRELDLTQNQLTLRNPAVFFEGIMANTSLHTLKLAVNQVSMEGGEALGTLLEVTSSLRYLSLENSLMHAGWTSKLCSALAQNNSLEFLDLSHNMWSNANMVMLQRSLLQNTALRTLCLDGMVGFDADEVICWAPLMRALAFNTTLLHLRIARNMFGERAADELSRSLTSNHRFPLQHLEISCELLSNETLDTLCTALCTNTSLLSLDLGSVDCPAAVMNVCRLIKRNTTLQRLDVGSANDSHRILKALESNTCIQSLALSLDYSSSITSPGADFSRGDVIWRALSATLRRNTWLQHIFIFNSDWDCHTQLPPEHLHPVIEALRYQPRYHGLSLTGVNLAEALKIYWPDAYPDELEQGWNEAFPGVPMCSVDMDKLQLRMRQLHDDKLLAFVMGQHKRLASESIVRLLSHDCVRSVMLSFYGVPVDCDLTSRKVGEFKQVLMSCNMLSNSLYPSS